MLISLCIILWKPTLNNNEISTICAPFNAYIRSIKLFLKIWDITSWKKKSKTVLHLTAFEENHCFSFAISVARSFSNERYLHLHDSWNTSICGSDEIQMCAHWWISRNEKTVGNITKQKHYSIRISIVCQMIERWWWKVFRYKHFWNVKTIKPKIKYPKIKYKRNHKF